MGASAIIAFSLWLLLMVVFSKLIPIIEIEEAQFCCYAWLTVNGITMNSNQADGTFDVDANQYLTATSKMDATDRPTFLMHANYDLTSHCFKNKKPTIRNGHFVSVTGFLTHVMKDDEGFPMRFIVDIDNVVYQGQAPPLTAPTTPPL